MTSSFQEEYPNLTSDQLLDIIKLVANNLRIKTEYLIEGSTLGDIHQIKTDLIFCDMLISTSKVELDKKV